MSGDYTRFGHDPRRRYTGVLLQQGRVSLDSDWNEAAEIADARLRAVARDALGPVAVAGETPDAFRVGLGSGGDLSLGAGRIWVDGLMAEILPGEGFSYLNQPFLRDPPALPEGPALVWLDVWQREVSWVEDPALLDVALGGADTTTRVQTVWQVRVEARDDAACGAAAEAASTGRMSARAVAPLAPDDPCLLPPVDGYRGLENRLYRIEIVEGGALGTARFAWSRDNGSVVAAVTANETSGAATTLSLDSLGRDPVMRFTVDDWVRVTEDARELAGLPGAMARVTEVREAERQLVLDRALPGWLPTDAAALEARHARVQRWDGQGDADGLIATAAGPIAIEAGIEVGFSDAGGAGFRTGDHWLFAARVADASVEALEDAPPRGIVHHHVQLAAVTAEGEVTDCRPQPPVAADGECCCIAVAPGESIQAAIDALPKAGGCVCLLPGLHPIRETIVIARSRVTLEAASGSAQVRMAGQGPALLLGSADDRGIAANLRVRGIAFSRGAGGRDDIDPSAILLAARVLNGAVEDCTFTGGVAGIGVCLIDCRDMRVERCRSGGALVGIAAGGDLTDDVVIADNVIWASGLPQVSITSTAGTAVASEVGVAGIAVTDSATRVRIEGNTVLGGIFGIAVDDPAGLKDGTAPLPAAREVMVLGNAVTTPGDAAGEAWGALPQIGIDVAGIGVRASGNRVTLTPVSRALAVGVRLAGFDLEANDNIVAAERGGGRSIGILAGHASAQEGAALALGGTIAQNSVTGCLLGIGALLAAGIEITGNRVTGLVPPRGPDKGGDLSELSFGIAALGTAGTNIHDNAVSSVATGILCGLNAGTRIAANTLAAGGAGVVLGVEVEPVLAGNRITAMLAGGILLFGAVGRAELSGNRLANCGTATPLGYGILAGPVAGELALDGNEVRDAGLRVDGSPGADLAVGIGGVLVGSAAVQDNAVTWTNPAAREGKGEDRALLLVGPLLPPPTFSPAGANVESAATGAAVITGNRFAGAGRSALVEVLELPVDKFRTRFGSVLFASNHVLHRPGGDAKGASVVLRGQALSVTGNHVHAPPKFPSFDLGGMPGPFMGNAMTGPVSGRGTELPAPMANFNVILPF